MSKQVPVNRKGIKVYALVDDEDYEKVNKIKWQLDVSGYAITIEYFGMLNGKRKQKVLFMHTLILGKKEGCEIDHKNLNKLDNQKHNLRYATRTQNRANMTKYKSNTTGFKGVIYVKKTNKYRGCITINKHKIMLGTFKTAKEAAKAYDKKAIELFKEFALLNFN